MGAGTLSVPLENCVPGTGTIDCARLSAGECALRSGAGGRGDTDARYILARHANKTAEDFC